jgi:hypothetical protein
MGTMGDDLRALLAELYDWGKEHDARQRRHADRLRNLEPETASLVSVLVRSSGAYRGDRPGPATNQKVAGSSPVERSKRSCFALSHGPTV